MPHRQRNVLGDDPAPPLARTLSELAALLRERKRDLPEGSYSAELFRKGRGAIAQKAGEEALELALAAVAESPERALSEFTDVVYALLVLATDLRTERRRHWAITGHEEAEPRSADRGPAARLCNPH